MPDLLSRLRAGPRRRIELRDVLSAFTAANPDLANDPQRNSVLLAELRRYQEMGAVQLPAAGSWDRRLSPPMPLFITLAKEVVAASQAPAPGAWAPELGFWPELRNAQLVDARKISDWLLANTQATLRVPLKERSLEIFGDEKRLDALRDGRALFAGRLSLDTLRTFVVSPPLPYRSAQTASRRILVVENHCSYWSFGEWNTQAGRWRAVVYGAGNGFAGAADALLEVCRELGLLAPLGCAGADMGSPEAPAAAEPLHIEYLGDLDPKGVRIPLDFNNLAASGGHPGLKVAPLLGAYRGLLNHAPRRARADLAESPTSPLGHAHDWLGPELGAQACEMWSSGEWIAQEALGYRQLVEQPERFLG